LGGGGARSAEAGGLHERIERADGYATVRTDHSGQPFLLLVHPPAER
jgi:hypothetical protein